MKYFVLETFKKANFINIIFAALILVASIALNVLTSNTTNNNVLLFIHGVTGVGIPSFAIIFVVVLPASLSLYEDMNHGFLQFILTRMNFKKYYIYKLLSVGIINGLLVSIILMLFLLVSLFYSPLPDHILNNFTVGAFKELYPNNKVLYSLIFIFNSFVFSFVFSILGLVTTLFWKNSYAPSIITFVIYLISEPFFGIINLNWLGFTNLFNYSDNSLTTPASIYSTFALILLVETLVGYFKFKEILYE